MKLFNPKKDAPPPTLEEGPSTPASREERPQELRSAGDPGDLGAEEGLLVRLIDALPSDRSLFYDHPCLSGARYPMA